jgi:hypothetical protein
LTAVDAIRFARIGATGAKFLNAGSAAASAPATVDASDLAHAPS